MPPRVSVVMPAYNCGRYVAQALASVVNQTEPDLEIIVCDDCSTDETVSVISSFAMRDRRIRLLHNDTNRGPSYTRNRAIRTATGAWVALLDSDDAYRRTRLSRLLDVAESSDFDLLADNLHTIDESGNSLNPCAFEFPEERGPFEVSTVLLLQNDSFIRPSLNWGFMKPIIRRDFLERSKILFDETTKIGEDFLFFVECLLRGGRMGAINESLYLYREVEGSLSRNGDYRNFDEMRKNNTKLMRMASSAKDATVVGLLRKRDSQLRHAKLYAKIVSLVRSGDRLKAATILLTHPRLWPFFIRKGSRYARASAAGIFNRVGSQPTLPR